jgi:RNA polymerase sigma-70 factor (ECF subfamily)
MLWLHIVFLHKPSIAAAEQNLQQSRKIFFDPQPTFCKIPAVGPIIVTGMALPHRSSDPEGELAPTRETLLERLRDLDDHASWQEFFDTYWKLIYCAAIKLGSSDQEAEEVVQETIIGVARKMETFRYDPQTCSFKGWLMHITRRRVIDRLRKRQTHPAATAALAGDTTTGGASWQIADTAAEQAFESMWDEEWEKNLMDAALERVKRKVAPEHYQIFYLHGVKNMPARDIAQLLGASTAKVYVVRHRVARMVRREVQTLARRRP